MDLDTSLGLRDSKHHRFKGTLVLVLTCAFGYQLVVTHYLKCFCLINKMVPSLGLNRSSNVVPVGPHEIEQTNDLDTREGGYIYIHAQLACVLLCLCCCSPFTNRARQGPGLGPGPRTNRGQTGSQLVRSHPNC